MRHSSLLVCFQRGVLVCGIMTLVLAGRVWAAEPDVVVWTEDGLSQGAELTSETLASPRLWQLTRRTPVGRSTRPAFWLHLAGRGRLGVSHLKWGQESIRFQLVAGEEEHSLDLGAVAGVQPLSPQAGWSTSDSNWRTVSNCQNAEDMVLLKNGDRQLGEISQVDSDSLQIDGELGQREIPWSTISGLRMNPDLAEPPAAGLDRWVVQLVDESWFLAKSLNFESDTWTIVLTNSLELKVAGPGVVWLAPLDTRRVPLSRLPIAGQLHRPLLGEECATAIDQNVSGLPLRRCESVDRFPSLSPMGLGMASGMRSRWKLDRQYDWLACHVGLDATATAAGDAVIRFWSGTKMLDEVSIRAGQPPQRVVVPLTETDELEIEVDFGKSGDLGDIVDLFHPVLFTSRK